ncbi:MAG: substrate-binding domain-containing protein [Dehalococcoidia bacterium]
MVSLRALAAPLRFLALMAAVGLVACSPSNVSDTGKPVSPAAGAAVSPTATTTAQGGGDRDAAAGESAPDFATTTSTVDTGLLEELLPVFERQTGYKVVLLSLGSGQAIATAERGEADVLLVHSPDAEVSSWTPATGWTVVW